MSNLKPGSSRATGSVDVAAGANTGERQVTVTGPGGPGGTSAPMPFFIRAPAAPAAPVISNVTLRSPVVSMGYITLAGHFDYQDPDGDIVWAGDSTFVDSVRIRYVVNLGSGTCTMEATGRFLNNPGRTSGSVDFSVMFRLATSTVGTNLSGIFQLQDVAGNRSNGISFTPPWWACGN